MSTVGQSVMVDHPGEHEAAEKLQQLNQQWLQLRQQAAMLHEKRIKRATSQGKSTVSHDDIRKRAERVRAQAAALADHSQS